MLDWQKSVPVQSWTITADNGKEFAEHERIENETNAPVYFAHSYSSWERGTNENTNGHVKQYFPKRSSFEHLTDHNMAFVIRTDIYKNFTDFPLFTEFYQDRTNQTQTSIGVC